MLDYLYELTRDVIRNIMGYSINEVMETDFQLLIEILFKEKEEKQEEVMSLNDFVRSL